MVVLPGSSGDTKSPGPLAAIQGDSGHETYDGLICDCLVVCWSPCCWLGKKTQQTFWNKNRPGLKTCGAFFHGILSQARKLERVKHRVCPNHTFTQILAYLTPVLLEKTHIHIHQIPTLELVLLLTCLFLDVVRWLFLYSFLYLFASLFLYLVVSSPFLLKTITAPTSLLIRFLRPPQVR